ncbi:hypothetical protein [Casimicrobium huifangae]|uniref:hypothetical protein n=1 Tax=Casimicrobium huifangae TaxID=2591109 RepID=UPI0037834F2E
MGDIIGTVASGWSGWLGANRRRPTTKPCSGRRAVCTATTADQNATAGVYDTGHFHGDVSLRSVIYRDPRADEERA